MSPEHDSASRVLIDPWLQLDKLVAAGTMGEVWRGYHRGLDRPVAVKLLSKELVSQDEVRERFRREARAAAKIESAHVVRYLDYGETRDGRPFIVMEWLTGVTLQQLLDEQGPLAPRKVAFIIEQLASALGAVHAAGVVHRDVKPDNILLVPSSSRLLVKLVDFSVSTCTERKSKLTQPGTLVGTPAYMSREQILYGHADWRSDLWSLGVVAYELLTGELPFFGDTVGAMCAAIVEGSCCRPSALVPELGEAVDTWFEKATAHRPEERFHSASELAAGFLAAIGRSFGEDAVRRSDGLLAGGAPAPRAHAEDDDLSDSEPTTTTLSPAIRNREEEATPRRWRRRLAFGAGAGAIVAAGYVYTMNAAWLEPLWPRRAAAGLSGEATRPVVHRLAEARIADAGWRDHALYYEEAYLSCNDALAANVSKEPEPAERASVHRARAVQAPARAAAPTVEGALVSGDTGDEPAAAPPAQGSTELAE